MPDIILNGRAIRTEPDQTVLEAARTQGVFIPTLCHHPGLPPSGACRLCLVEVKAGFRPGLAASCALPSLDGLVVETESPAVVAGRRLVMELLLARAPESGEIRALAARLGVERTPFPPKNELCILCGRCVRTCHALGIDAIAFVQRGAQRRVAVPFDKPSAQCIACQACVAVCPTGAVHAKITATAVELVEWHSSQPLRRCAGCNRPFVSEGLKNRSDAIAQPHLLPPGALCPACRRRATAAAQAAAGIGSALVPPR
ncbi:MAG: hypothetical protein BWK76_14865 [Desulfobulbaceae bacterium A2]|nr:MAG: hypothetical protein BWK76_14865 [Desulfobulbaceae bacterium A2]